MQLRIKEIIREKGLSVKEVAEKMGIMSEALSRIINGKNTTITTLERIANALDVPVSELIDEPKAGNFTCPNCGTELRLTAEKVGKE